MAIDRELRRRVERLLDGTCDVEDLNRLFLGLRERFYSRQAFQEIGDFTAHADERIKGVVSARAKDFFVHLRYRLPMLDGHRYEISGCDAGRALRASLNLLSDDMLPWPRAEARSLLGRIERKILKITSNGVTASKAFTPKERALFDHLNSFIGSTPAFTGDALFQEFGEVLMRNRLLAPEEAPALEQARTFIAAYGGWRMHQCRVRLEGGDHATLRLSRANDSLVVSAIAPITTISSGLEIALQIYAAKVELAAVLSPELLGMEDWDFPLTIGQDRLIRAL